MNENSKNQIEEIKSLQKIISSDFAKNTSESLIPNNDFEKLDEFRKYLTEKLSFLLDNNYDSLINTLYRIDVNEEKVSELFSGSNRSLIPDKLADLIIDRQFQKIRFRKQYRNGKI